MYLWLAVDHEGQGPRHAGSASARRPGYTPIEYKKHAEAYAGKVLGIVSAAAKLAGVGCETLHVEHEHVYEAIIDAAASRRCDLILMASHGRRGSRRLSSAARRSKYSRTRRSPSSSIAEVYRLLGGGALTGLA